MRSLNRCDFCDGEAAGTFEILPPSLEPTESEQRRVLLCGGCRDQLEEVLSPLLARLDADDEFEEAGKSDDSTDSTDSSESNATGDSTEASPDAAGEDSPTEAPEPDEAGVSDDAEPSNDGERSGRSSSDSPPQSYGKVVRLLRNREFPMERDDVESLAAGAYELGPDEVDAIVEYAIDEGEVREDGDRLVRP